MRLIDRPEEFFPAVLNSMRESYAIQSILAKALVKARESNRRVKSVQLAIGEMAELDQSSILRHWNELSQDTAAERAQLNFRFIKAELQCMACFEKYHPVNGQIHCPYCNSYGAKVLSGEEFYLESVELTDE
jgi:hydrogenase nickel incorporation protein HypA/HybF